MQPNIDRDRTTTIDAWLALAQNQQMILHMTYIGTKCIGTLKQLEDHMECFIHINNLRGYPVKLQDLNRRFYRVAKQLGTTVTEVINGMLGTGVLVGHVRVRTCLYATTNFAADRETIIKDAQGWIVDDGERAVAIEQARANFWLAED